MKAYYNINEILISIRETELRELSEHCFDAYRYWQKKAENAKTEWERGKCGELADEALIASTKIEHILDSMPF